MADSRDFGDYRNHRLYRELTRIFGDLERVSFSFCLPGIGEEDDLEFLRTVPAGTPPDQLPALAEAWRRRRGKIPEHPWPGDIAG